MLSSSNKASSPTKKIETSLWGFLTLGTIVSGLLSLMIFTFLFKESIPFIKFLSSYEGILSRSWFPLEGEFNFLPIIVGSLLATVGSFLLTVPLGVLLALFLCYYSPKTLTKVLEPFIEVFSGLPSVVIGLWGLVVLVPYILQWTPPGASLLAAIVILSIMTLPTVTLIIKNRLEAIPRERLITAQALGLPKTTTLLKIFLPEVRSGIIKASVLQVGRAMGETMAVLMVCGNIPQIPKSLFAPIRTLTTNIALEMSYATDIHRSSLFFSGFILAIIATLLALLAHRYQKDGVL